MRNSPRTVAVIGAGGFVGSNLCRYIEESYSDRASVSGFGRESFDIAKPDTWSALPTGCNCLVHAAARIDGTPRQVLDANAGLAGELAEFCNARRVGKVIYLSTGAVYGAVAGPASAATPEAPESPYAVAKLQAERSFLETFTGPVNVVRLYFPYGRGQKPLRLFPRLAASIRNGEAVACNPGGGPRLSVVHIDDVSAILVRDFILGDRSSGKWNVASDETVTVGAAAVAIAKALGRAVRLSEDGNRPDVLSVPYARTDGKAWRRFDAGDVLA